MDALPEAEAAQILERHIVPLRALSFEQAQALPEASEERAAEHSGYAVTVFAQRDLPGFEGSVLVTVQLARRSGLASYHTERGLIFSPAHPPREASREELRNSGG